MFNIGGYNSAFLPFFRDLEILGGYSGFADFSSFNDFENLGVYSGSNENVLKQLKTRIRMHKINKCIKSINDEGILCSQITIYMFTNYNS